MVPAGDATEKTVLSWRIACSRATRSSMAAIPITRTTSAALKSSDGERNRTTSTSAPAAACGASSAAIA